MPNQRKSIYLLIGLITIFRLLYVNYLPLVPQEAYYWKYARNLALSYFDHPPMVAYTIAFFTWLGGDHVFFIRLSSIIFMLGFMILVVEITRRLFDKRQWAFDVIILINCTILFSIGATIITPDVPLLFFWALLIYWLVRLKETPHWKWWYFIGATLGLALLSKYTAILIVPAVFLYILLSTSQRKWLFTPYPYLALLIAAIMFSPVIIWNYQHEWSSFSFQSAARFSSMSRFRVHYFFQLLGSQAGVLTPYIFFLLLCGWLYAGKKGIIQKNDTFSLLFWISLPVYAVFTLSSFRSLVKMNWLAPAYITSLIASIAWMEAAHTTYSDWFKRWFKVGLVFGLTLVVLAHLLPIFHFFPIRSGDSWTGWQQLAAHVMKIKNQMGDDTFIFSHDYKIPSEITYYTPNHLPTHAAEIIGQNGLQYNFWTNISELIHKDALFVYSNAHRFKDFDRLKKYFQRVEPDSPLKISFHNRIFRIFYFYRCYGYKGLVDKNANGKN